MSYIFLDPPLHSTATAAKRYFTNEMGFSRFKIEEPIAQNIDFRPTISCNSTEKYLVCIEVSESAWPLKNVLDTFALDCKNQGLPIKLYVAMPKGAVDPNFSKNLRRAQECGVGVLELDINGAAHIYHDALALSLTGLRPYIPKDFPPKHRATLKTAQSTFLKGNPSEGCGELYDIIEKLCRGIGEKANKKGYWKPVKPGNKIQKIKFDTDPWAKVMKYLEDHLDIGKCKCPQLKETLLARIRGLTQHRNDSRHKPKNLSQLKQRDQELRTRFETARDTMRDLIAAIKPLKL